MRIEGNSPHIARARRAFELGVALAFAIFAVEGPVFGQAAQDAPRWLGTWFASSTVRVDQPAAPAQSAPSNSNGQALEIPPAVLAVAPTQTLVLAGQSPLHFNNQTLRQIVHVTVGGSRLRVVLSNTFGTVPLTIGAAQVALRDRDAAIMPRSNRILTFGREARTTVPAGAVLISDPVDLVVRDFADLTIDLYLPDDTAATEAPITTHAASWQTNYVSTPGNHAGIISMPVQTTTAYRRSADGLPGSTWFFLARVEVMAPPPAGAIVTLGDSLTDGTASTIDTNNRWPDHLARRLAKAGARMAVLNAGIGGNRVLNEGNGPSALARFDRDVIAQTGVTHVIVFEGINDIGQGRQNASPSAADLIGAHKQMIERAHARGIKVYGATLTPFEGANYWTSVGEAKRQALNEWIRTSKAYDAVFDFDAAVRDPNHPTKTLAQYDSGDHLHLNAAGYEAVANIIDLALLRLR
jgi:lysophospholipase L1-like esterase